MIYLVARAIPRVSEIVAPVNQRKPLDELVKKIPFDKIDAFLNSLTAKFLRKAKIFVLKLDNLISQYLTKFKTNGSGKEALNRGILEREENQAEKGDSSQSL